MSNSHLQFRKTMSSNQHLLKDMDSHSSSHVANLVSNMMSSTISQFSIAQQSQISNLKNPFFNLLWRKVSMHIFVSFILYWKTCCKFRFKFFIHFPKFLTSKVHVLINYVSKLYVQIFIHFVFYLRTYCEGFGSNVHISFNFVLCFNACCDNFSSNRLLF